MKQDDLLMVTIGDCCIDHYTALQKSFLGGGAFNVACEARRLGARVDIISSVGNDIYGKAYISFCQIEGIGSEFLSQVNGTTSTIDVVLQNDSPIYSNWQLGVLENKRLRMEEKTFIATQDIAHSVLFTPLLKLFKDFCNTSCPHTLKVGDFSGASEYTKHMDTIEEFVEGLDIVVKSFGQEEKESMQFFHHIAKTHDKICIALLGAKGSVVFTKDKTYTNPALETQVVDTSGAGDIYIGAFMVSFKKTKNILYSMKEATKEAAKVVSYLGVSKEIDANVL